MSLLTTERPVQSQAHVVRVKSISVTVGQLSLWRAFPERYHTRRVTAELEYTPRRYSLIELEVSDICRVADAQGSWVIKGRTSRSNLAVAILWNFAQESGAARVSA